MNNQEKFFGLAYKVLLYFVWIYVVTHVIGLGALIGLLIRKFF
mgnify:CR=1 FL=1